MGTRSEEALAAVHATISVLRGESKGAVDPTTADEGTAQRLRLAWARYGADLGDFVVTGLEELTKQAHEHRLAAEARSRDLVKMADMAEMRTKAHERSMRLWTIVVGVSTAVYAIATIAQMFLAHG